MWSLWYVEIWMSENAKLLQACMKCILGKSLSAPYICFFIFNTALRTQANYVKTLNIHCMKYINRTSFLFPFFFFKIWSTLSSHTNSGFFNFSRTPAAPSFYTAIWWWQSTDYLEQCVFSIIPLLTTVYHHMSW